MRMRRNLARCFCHGTAFLICLILNNSSALSFELNCLEWNGCALQYYQDESVRKNNISSNVAKLVLKCRGQFELTENISAEVTFLHLCDISKHTLNLKSVLARFPGLQHVEVINSNVSHLIGPGRPNNITFLRIVNTTLRHVGENFPNNMRHLHVLDLRRNQMETLPRGFFHNQRVKHIYLSSNRWKCTEEHLRWAWNYTSVTVQDNASVNCHDKVFNEKPLFAIAKFQKEIAAECPIACTCCLDNVIRELEDFNVLTPIISASCSNLGLARLPDTLPNRTRIVRLENNSISDLSPIITNRAYKHVIKLYLDNNEIRSIATLEGGQWLERFSVLSLRYNKLSQLPTYALDNALGRNMNMPNAVRFYLSGNPWRCECAYTPHFQEMLMKYEKQIADISDVRCREKEADENSKLAIITLTKSSICRQPPEYYIKPLDLVNIVLASLIVLVLGKFAYDYYFFKKTGKLPWIVNRIP